LIALELFEAKQVRYMSSVNSNAAENHAASASSPLAPFEHPVFAVLWIATVVSNIGTWMQSAAASWLITDLSSDPFVVSLVQVATSLPMFIFALPAGALADIVDRRWLMLSTQAAIVALVGGFSVLVWTGRVNQDELLAFTFLASTAAALTMPVWQAIVPQLVSRPHLQAAVTLNSVGVNVSRAVGPALSGLIIAAWGIAAPFWVNAVTTLGVIAALIWWRPSNEGSTRALPREQFRGAIRAGLRHARFNPDLRATLIRAAGFFVFASAYWALLPLVARNRVDGGAGLYGVLLGAIGAGAVGGAFALPVLKRRLGADRLVAAGTVGTAVALLLFGIATQPVVALFASVIAGAAWIAVLATINVSAQVALPAWVRGRGLSVFGTVLFGSLTLGSAIWGKVATLIPLPLTLFVAGLGAVLMIPLLRRWELQTGAVLDLAPSMHWPAPALTHDVETDRGPVLVTVDYRIDPSDRDAFLAAVESFAVERRRDGAFDWSIFEDVASEGHFVETFMLDSWVEHLRQHDRVTHADRAAQVVVNRFQVEGVPTVTHLIASGSPDLYGRFRR
jgi:predicted MFS family arabinose efflux permease